MFECPRSWWMDGDPLPGLRVLALDMTISSSGMPRTLPEHVTMNCEPPPSLRTRISSNLRICVLPIPKEIGQNVSPSVPWRFPFAQ